MDFFSNLYTTIMNIISSFFSSDNNIFAQIKNFLDGLFAK